MSNTETYKSRVMHVPLTDAQWKAVKIEATMSEQTIGELVARALVRAIPSVGKVTA
jgi:hypothetical protein